MERRIIIAAIVLAFCFGTTFSPATIAAESPTAPLINSVRVTFQAIGTDKVWTNYYSTTNKICQLEYVRYVIEDQGKDKKVLKEKIFKKGESIPATLTLTAAADPNVFYAAAIYLGWTDQSAPHFLKAGFKGTYAFTLRFVPKEKIQVMDIYFR